jgi:hypothetical protein
MIAQRARLQEGDLVGALQKTLDLIGQLRNAAQQGPVGTRLVPLLDQADGLIRRGVVEAGYRWAVAGLPEPEQTHETEAWDVPIVVDDERPPRERVPRMPRARAVLKRRAKPPVLAQPNRTAGRRH